MDSFVPHLQVGAPVVAELKTPLLKDVHLMIENPLGLESLDPLLDELEMVVLFAVNPGWAG